MGATTAVIVGGMVVSAATGAIAAADAEGQAELSRTDQNTLNNAITDAENTRQDITNPYANMTNPYNNLSVATGAAKFQAEQTDIALANTLDTLRASGSGSGGATALAQAAAKSKQEISADIQKQEKQKQEIQVKSQEERLSQLDKYLQKVNAQIKKLEGGGSSTYTIKGQVITVEQGKTIAALTSKLSILDNISKAYGGTVSVLNSKTDAYRNTIATLIAQGMKPMNPIIQGYIAKLNALVLAQKKAVSPGEKLADSLTKINALQSALGSSYDGVTAKLNIFTNALNRGLQSGGLSIQEYNYLNNTIKKLKAELAKRATNDIFKDTAKSLALANRNSKLFGNSFNKLNVELRIYTNALEQLKSVKGPFTIEQLNMIKLYSHNIELLQAKLEALSRKQQVFNILGNAAAQMAFQIGKSFVDFSNGLSGIVDIVLNAAQQVIDALLATAIVAVIAKNAAMPWGLIGAAVGLGALMALWDSYKAKAVSSAHLAEGGIIPDGYPGDRYPAMLSSREAVIPLDKLPGILEGAFSGGKTRQVKFVINGKVLEAIMDEQNSYNDVY